MSIGNVISGIGLGASLLKGNKAEKRAGRAQDAQLAIAGRQEDRADEQFEIYKKTYLPEAERIRDQNKLLDPQETASKGAAYDASTAASKFFQDEILPGQSELLDDANIDPEYYASRAAADADTATSRAINTQDRGLTEAGVDPSSGAAIAAKAGIRRIGAASRSAEVNRSRIDAEERNFNRKSIATGRAAGVAQGPGTPSVTGINTGTAGLAYAGNTLGQVSRNSFGQAGQYASAAGESARGLPSAVTDFEIGSIFSPPPTSGGSTNINPFGAGNPGREHGGPVEPGQSYTVGEAGPETLHMDNSGGYVTPGVEAPQKPQIDPRMVEQMIQAYLTRDKTGLSRAMA